MYAMCRDRYPTDAPDVPLFLFFLRLQGLNWPERPHAFQPPLQLVLRLAYVWHCPFWMSVSVLKVPDNSTRTGTRLRLRIRPSMLVPILVHHHRVARSAYTTYWEQFYHHIYPNSSTRPALNETAVDEIRDMEGHILETLSSVGKTAVPKPTVLRESIPNEQKFNFTDEVVVSDIHLLLTVSDFLRKYDEAQLNMHLTWLVVQYYAPVADYRMLVDHYGNAYRAAAYLPVFCGHHVEASYKVLVLALDVASRFEARDVKIVNDGFEGLVSAALGMVNASNWMDDESKARLTKKVLAVKKSLWPPDAAVNADMLDKVFGDFPENSASFAAESVFTRLVASHLSMTGPYEEAMLLPWNSLPGNVLYDYVSNTIEIPTGTVAAPAYYSKGAKSMLYGGLLFILATHLVRAFDAEGVKWTPSGTKVDSILSNTTMLHYRDRESCLAEDGTSEQSLFPEVPAFSNCLHGHEAVPRPRR
ncbi:hypothetical protein MTO96_011102 [Rhipicephalus appendiculatus]